MLATEGDHIESVDVFLDCFSTTLLNLPGLVTLSLRLARGSDGALHSEGLGLVEVLAAAVVLKDEVPGLQPPARGCHHPHLTTRKCITESRGLDQFCLLSMS